MTPKSGVAAAGLIALLAHSSAAMAATPTPGGRTSQIAICGAVAKPRTETLASLRLLVPHTETVTYMTGGKSVSDTYTGALLWDTLNAAGVILNPSIKNDVLRKVVIATGSDGYRVALSLGELSPKFGHAPVLVAYADTAGQLAGPAGFARLVVPGDRAGGRYVSSLTSLVVVDPTASPEDGEHRPEDAGQVCPNPPAAGPVVR